MKIMIADDYYTDFALYETNDREDLISAAADIINREGGEIDEDKHQLLYDSADGCDLDFAEVRDMADEVLFVSELFREEDEL